MSTTTTTSVVSIPIITPPVVKKRSPLGTMLVDIGAGCLAGINVTIVGHPLETLKVKMQCFGDRYTGVLDCFKKTVAAEGFGGLYKGVGAPLGGQLFFRSFMFGINANYLKYMTKDAPTKPLTYFQYGLGGAISWGFGAILECPLQLASSQMQTQTIRLSAAAAAGQAPPESFTGIVDYIKRAPRLYGMDALYRGFFSQLCRNIPAGFFHFFVFEYVRREIAKYRGVSVLQVGLLTNMFAGSVAGIFFWGSTYPIDVVKSALQGDSLDPKLRKYQNMGDAFKKLYAEGGYSRFTRGLSACMLRAVPANAVLLSTANMVREIGYDYLDKQQD